MCVFLTLFLTSLISYTSSFLFYDGVYATAHHCYAYDSNAEYRNHSAIIANDGCRGLFQR